MADSYRAWLRGAVKWQQIAVIDLRDQDGIGKLLQTAGLKNLGEVDALEGLELPGIGVGVVKRIRSIIKTSKAVERRRRPTVIAPRRLARVFPQ